MAHNRDMPVTPDPEESGGRLGAGVAVIRGYLDGLPGGPGVYRMLSAKGAVLYVGKARNLKRRVASYTQLYRLPVRLQRMVSETAAMEFVSTHTEVEALLLESNLIKKLAPRYNVLLRDDKSFPNILIRTDHDYPQIVKHRGPRTAEGDYYGPFASAGAVNRTVTALQRAFLLRNCSDAIFASRTRPCLQYQIKRCSAPCVNRIDADGYGALVAEARAFLEGDSKAIQARLADEMNRAAEALDFERAARLRDRIRALAQISAHQDINVEGLSDADVIAAHTGGGTTCVQVFFIRGGRNNGNRAYYPSHDKTHDLPDILAAFIGQFYDARPAPREILVCEPPAEAALLEQALALRADRKVRIHAPKRGPRRGLVAHALTNAREAHGRRVAESGSQRKLLDGLARALDLAGAPERIEVYDNSHIQGDAAVGAMIVAGPEGFAKNQYRKWTIKGAEPTARGGDDYAMMREVFTRRFKRALKDDPDRDKGLWPDLVIVDGGKGQLSEVEGVLAELGIDEVALLAVSKGPDRDAGRESLHRPGVPAFMLERRDPVLYYIQRLRDEAHRFAIGSHRQKRAKAIAASPLDAIPGIGAKRKKALLMHFGSAKAVARAGVKDLAAVEGISEAVARTIYGHFHER